jgi:alpha-tubulin suppressor-like RCC1 family protein
MMGCGNNQFKTFDSDISVNNSIINLKSNFKIKQLAGGKFFIAVLTTDGCIYTMGSNEFGQLGYNTDNYNDPNGELKMIENFYYNNTLIIRPIFKKIVCGANHMLGLTIRNNVYSWGSNEFGQLCYQTNDEINFNPKFVKNKIKDIFGGGLISSLIDYKNRAFMAGNNKYGQLGYDNNRQDINYLRFNQLINIKEVFIGMYHTIFLTNTKIFYVCGDNTHGQIIICSKIIDYNPTPTKLIITDNYVKEKIIKISCGLFHTLLLTSNNKLFTAGDNSFGQLGILTNDLNINHIPYINNCEILFQSYNSYTDIGYLKYSTNICHLNKIPSFLKDNDYIVHIISGYNHNLVITNNGYIYTFGENTYCELFIEHMDNIIVIPTKSKKISKPKTIIAGCQYTILLK